METVKLTIIKSSCRSGYHKEGQTYIVGDINPPICSELWYSIYPYVCVLRSGGKLDCGDEEGTYFTCCCPDQGRVQIKGEIIT